MGCGRKLGHYDCCSVGIYIASRARHAQRWRELRGSGVPIISTWIDEAGLGETQDFSDLWQRCISEASHAGALVAYSEDGEGLVGGLIEIGAGLAMGVHVFVTGESLGLSKVCHHPLATRCASLDSAIDLARQRIALIESQPN